MSQESLRWLNQNCLIGFSDKRGKAWHYRASDQGAEPNHYPEAIPVEDVRRRLFPWEAVEGKITAVNAERGLVNFENVYKAIMRSDDGHIMGIFREGYAIHQFDEWLLYQVAILLDGDLGIGGAGLLKQGAVAYVSIELPDTIVTPSGVPFRPRLLCTTSHDASLATQWKRVKMITVCDNTMRAGLSEGGAEFRVRHSKYSGLRLQEARDALGIMFTMQEDDTAELEKLCTTTVTDLQWEQFLESLAPTSGEGITAQKKRNAEVKQTQLDQLYQNDERVRPWAGSAFGVVQAVNTAAHHIWGSDEGRVERNDLRAVMGGIDRLDSETLDRLNKVLVAA